MSKDDTDNGRGVAQKPRSTSTIFSLPAPLKRLFDRFPLITYATNELPLGVERGTEHVLYVFTTAEDARLGRASFNPRCLRWQAFLKFANVAFRTASSNNHASPTGSLPYLLPVQSSKNATEVVPSNKLQKWIAAQKRGTHAGVELEDVRYDAYLSLIDHNIRRAWLYQLYLQSSNSSLVHHLYVARSSSNPFVHLTIQHQLYQAAEMELVKSSSSTRICETDLLRDASEAFSALSTLLGEDDWFFAARGATMFDASVFAYTRLLMDEGGLEWKENKLGAMLAKHTNLVRHQQHICKLYF